MIGLPTEVEPVKVIQGDCLEVLRDLPDGCVQCAITSPPYFGLRDYGCEGQVGLEPTPEAYVARLVEVFREVRRVLCDSGVLWLNLGDSYGGNGQTGRKDGGRPQKDRGWVEYDIPRTSHNRGTAKQLLGIPWRVAFALQADGWLLRSEVIWHKPNPMPESVRDRPTKAHEQVFLLAKSGRYFYDADAVAEATSGASGWARQRARGIDTWKYNDTAGRIRATGQRVESSTPGRAGVRNRRSVWTIAPKPFKGAHFAVMPEALVEPCLLAGCPVGGLVLDPFAGAATVGVVAQRLGRRFLGAELNPAYVEIARARLARWEQVPA